VYELFARGEKEEKNIIYPPNRKADLRLRMDHLREEKTISVPIYESDFIEAVQILHALKAGYYYCSEKKRKKKKNYTRRCTGGEGGKDLYACTFILRNEKKLFLVFTYTTDSRLSKNFSSSVVVVKAKMAAGPT